MDNNERQLITHFLDQLVQVRGFPKDPEIESLIRNSASKQPDALYLLVQKALIQEQALKQAQLQIDQLQNEINEARSQPSQNNNPGFFSGAPFLNNRQPMSQPGSGYYNQPQGYTNAQQPSSFLQGAGNSPFSGFLANAATTAVGVAGGSFLVEGIHNLFGGGHHHEAADHSNGFFSSNDNQNSSYEHEQPMENITNVNNYYQDPDADLFSDLDNSDSLV